LQQQEADACPTSMREEGINHNQAKAVEVEHDTASETFRIWWKVDTKKTSGTDLQIASSTFSLEFSSGWAQFRLILRAVPLGKARRQGNFKKSKGRCYIEVRCLDTLEGPAPLSLRLAVGTRQHPWDAEVRGPFTHAFNERPVFSLPEAVKEWNFGNHIDPESESFDVCLEILEGAFGASS